jgi:tetratricopeptide (TPR) repeat protein
MFVARKIVRLLPAIALMALLSESAVLHGQTRDENWKRCGGGDSDRAIEACSALIQSGQETGLNLAAVLYDRGLTHAHEGDYDLAIEDYDAAIRLNANLANAFAARGAAYAHKRDYDHPIQECDQALRLKPSFPDAFYSRGLAYADEAAYDRAIADYDRALRLSPNDANAIYHRGVAYAKKGPMTGRSPTMIRCCGWIRSLPMLTTAWGWHTGTMAIMTVPFSNSISRCA